VPTEFKRYVDINLSVNPSAKDGTPELVGF
jgi:hypothetical protein